MSKTKTILTTAALGAAAVLIATIPARCSTPMSPTPYCAAVRGNGTSMPAHWGALGEMMETYGAPVGMAGGSSASITTFLWESASMNPLVKSTVGFERGRRLALLFKSLEGVSLNLYNKPKWNTLVKWALLAQTSPPELTALLNAKQLAEVQKDLPQITLALKDLISSGIFFGPAFDGLFDSIASARPGTPEADLVWARLQALKQTVAVFGKFDADSDRQLFIRPGIVDFPKLARQFGALADFLSLRNASSDVEASMKTFFRQCLPVSVGQSWEQIAAHHPDCQTSLNAALDSYFNNYDLGSKDSRVYDRVGEHSLSIVSTAVVNGASATQFRALRDAYLKTYDPSLGGDFHIASSDLHFGYFGSTQVMPQVDRRMHKQALGPNPLDKVSRFMDLGRATWMQALSLSPAEPGLSAAVEFDSVGFTNDLLSFGGWADLHPVQLLQAAGCEKVIYVQRRGGDAVFSEGVVKRLLSSPQLAWINLNGQATSSRAVNDTGLASDQTSIWSTFFNVQNPRSNYAASLSAASAVICTNWDDYDPASQSEQLIDSAYHSPIYEAETMAHAQPDFAKFITKRDNAIDASTGRAPYVGCIPLQ